MRTIATVNRIRPTTLTLWKTTFRVGAIAVALVTFFGPGIAIAQAATVRVPAGSTDALADAIAEAGPGGRVVLESGLHTESGTVEVNARVTIVGENGAILESSTTGATGFPLSIEPALHIKSASRTRVKNIWFRPSCADATCGILIEDSSRVRVSGNRITGFQVGVLVQRGDRANIRGNVIETDPFVADAPNNGIVIVNGRFARIMENSVSNGFSGIFCGDRQGTLKGNHVEGNVIGILLCTPAFLYSISGEVAIPDTPATRWLVHGNHATGNDWGYLVIDGANDNLLINNDAAGNMLYDIELAGESARFGALQPTSSGNCVIQLGSDRDDEEEDEDDGEDEDENDDQGDGDEQTVLVVKVCGIDNTARGNVVLVDTAIDPCF